LRFRVYVKKKAEVRWQEMLICCHVLFIGVREFTDDTDMITEKETEKQFKRNILTQVAAKTQTPRKLG